jgi:hypothetical protein
MRALFALVLSGCTLVVGGDPSFADPDASAADTASDASVIDTSDAGTSQHDDEKSADVAPNKTCDAGGCNATKDACKKTCAVEATACNAACAEEAGGKPCQDLCKQKQTACIDECVVVCDQCVMGCGPPCPN